MATYWYERMAASDRPFLVFEGQQTHMHLGGVSIFESGSLMSPDGGVDIDRVRGYVGSRLHYIPRYRQRLAYVPIESYPVWVDDDRLNLHYHVRHTSLPRPGDENQLKRLTARIMSQRLDRRRPLWEVWIVEGLEGGRFALILKTHHCVVDGVSGVDLMSVLLRPQVDDGFEDAPAWVARPVPTPNQLLRDETLRRATAPLGLVRQAERFFRGLDLNAMQQQLAENLTATWDFVTAGLRRPADTPLNRPIGPHRRFDWYRLDLAEVKAVKNRLGGTVNDVILTTVAGALHHYLKRKGVAVESVDYKTVVPVSVRSGAEVSPTGNRVAAWMLSLPIDQADPRVRMATVSQITAHLKRSKQVQGVEMLAQVAQVVDPILTLGIRLASQLHPYNLIVTNVAGPQFPLYLLGARMLEGYPTVPLFAYQGLGIATFSYDGKLFWGCNADWDLVPDLADFVTALSVSFRELYNAAHQTGAVTHRPATRRRRARSRRAATVKERG